MSDKKNDKKNEKKVEKKNDKSFSPRRLRELEHQLEVFTDEDFLKEAEQMEREMDEENITYDIPNIFFDRVLAKGKLLEAELERAIPSAENQNQDLNGANMGEAKTVHAAAVVRAEGQAAQAGSYLESVLEAGDKEKIPGANSEMPPIQEKIMNNELKPLDFRAGEMQNQKLYILETDTEAVKNTVSTGNAQPAVEAVSKLGTEDTAGFLDSPEDSHGISENIAGKIENVLRCEELPENDKKGTEGRKKARRGNLRWKVLILVAVLTVPLVFGVSSAGRKHFRLEQRQREDVDHLKISIYNGDYIDDEEGEIEVYNQIEQEIGIDALIVGDRPSEFFFDKVDIYADCSYIYFSSSLNDADSLVIKEALHTYEIIADITGDGKNIDKVQNIWLDEEIIIYGETLLNNRQKYTSVITLDNAYYLISGIMDLNDYKMVLKDLHF